MTETISQPSKQKSKKRKTILLTLSALFLIVGLAYLIYWYSVLRFYQSTDNAYVVGNQVQIMAQTNGGVAAIYVNNTDFIKQGDLLLILDPTDAEYAFEQAQNVLATAVRQTHQSILKNKQLQANVELKRLTLQQRQDDLQRREQLGQTRSIAVETLEHARKAVLIAKADLEMALQQYNVNNASVMKTPLSQQPPVKQAASQLRESWLSLQRTRIVSPVTGYVSRRSVQVGAQISKATPLMMIIPADQLWVEANFKEGQLANIRLGQPIDLVSDFYGDSVIYQGVVVGIDMGTGSAFSILPAQNATGNWIKIVQRLPIRIELDAEQLTDHPLRIGLSMHARVNTKNVSGQVLADETTSRTVYQTDTLSYDPTEVEKLINQIISANTLNDEWN